MVFISVLIIFIMLAISLMAFGIGHALQMNSWTRFAKGEIGEIVITILIIVFFVGTASVTNLLVSTNTFYKDCTTMGTYALGIAPITTVYGVSMVFTKLVSSTEVRIGTSFTGVKIYALQGYSIVSSAITILIDVSYALIFLMITVMIMLGVIYMIFPLFLYLGIVLRTIPWTRAAGGSFLGIFFGFYVAFPYVLSIMLAYLPAPVAAPVGMSAAACLKGITPDCFIVPGSFSSTIANAIKDFILAGYTKTLIVSVIVPVSFAFISVVISLYIGLEVSEIFGGLLGAPTLRSHDAIKNFI